MSKLYYRPSTSVPGAGVRIDRVVDAGVRKDEFKMNEDLPYLPITPPKSISTPLPPDPPFTSSMPAGLPTGPKGWNSSLAASVPIVPSTLPPKAVVSNAAAIGLKLSATWREKNILPVPPPPSTSTFPSLTIDTAPSSNSMEIQPLSSSSARPASATSTLPTGPRRPTLSAMGGSVSAGGYDRESEKERERKMLLNRYLPKTSIASSKIGVGIEIDAEVSHNILISPGWASLSSKQGILKLTNSFRKKKPRFKNYDQNDVLCFTRVIWNCVLQ
jgi:hypothetical protein